MSDADRFSDLIGGIYDATLDHALWPEVLEDVAEFVGGQTAGLLSKDSVSRIGDVHYSFGVDPHYIQLYRETYWQFDPIAPLLFCDVGAVTSRADFMPDDEFLQGRFHKEWAKPQGWIDAANVVLEKSSTGFSVLSSIRHETSGMVDDDMRRQMRLIAPHVRRAVVIGKVIERKTATADAFADALDGLSAGMFLVDQAGHLVLANASGHNMLADGVAMRRSGARIEPTDAAAARTLYEIVAAAGGGDKVIGARGIALPIAGQDGEQYVAHVLPLTSGSRRRAGANYAAVAAVFVRKSALEAPSPPEVIARQYGLTPTELRVLLAIVQIGGVPETADALGVGEATVKTHLHRVFGKTGATRQADLVKLVAGFSNPLVH